MVDWYGTKNVGKWVKEERNQLFAIAFSAFIVAFLAYIAISNVPYESDDSILMLTFIVVIAFFCGNTSYYVLLYLKKKDFLSKIFSFENSTILHAIENTLRNNNIQFIKRSEGGKVSQFPIKIVETFEIVDTQILIHVQKQTAMGTKVAVGPVRA